MGSYPLGENPPPPSWHTLQTSIHATCPLYTLYRQRCQHPHTGRTGDFYVIHAPAWVQALALTPQGQLILVQQYRFGSQTLTWETPGGLVEPGEDSIAAAVRELREETGYAGHSAACLGWAYPNAALQNNKVYFVLVRDCQPVAPVAWDEHEELRMACFDVPEVLRMARTGLIQHSLVLNGLFFLEDALQVR